MLLIATTFMDKPAPVLYSFRRCPYAIRARMALVYTGVMVELRNILLKDKPDDMVAASPKATVPVLKLEGDVLEESLDIMIWALEQNDLDKWLTKDESERATQFALITENDGPFKTSLDRYKYHVRFPEKPRDQYRQEGETFLKKLEVLLADHRYLISDEVSLADMAIFPFIRQFANTDPEWFESAPYPFLRNWLAGILASREFAIVMKKRTVWKEGTVGEPFPAPNGA
ncbi:MAG: glutathione S-transferase [Sneathiella sp.]|nr:glutathione S-transferase [Sneathiella sp.]